MKITMMNRIRLVAAVAVVTLASACMGSFVLTKGLYNWNDHVTGSKVVNNIIFWALNILPIYSLAVTGDAVIFNTIEFWTGKNLLADANDAPGKARVVVVENADGSVTVTRGAEQFVLVPNGSDRVDVVVNGKKVGAAERTKTGGMVAYDERGQEIAVVTPEEAEVGSTVAARAIKP